MICFRYVIRQVWCLHFLKKIRDSSRIFWAFYIAFHVSRPSRRRDVATDVKQCSPSRRPRPRLWTMGDGWAHQGSWRRQWVEARWSLSQCGELFVGYLSQGEDCWIMTQYPLTWSVCIHTRIRPIWLIERVLDFVFEKNKRDNFKSEKIVKKEKKNNRLLLTLSFYCVWETRVYLEGLFGVSVRELL